MNGETTSLLFSLLEMFSAFEVEFSLFPFIRQEVILLKAKGDIGKEKKYPRGKIIHSDL